MRGASGNSKSPDDPVAERIRELRIYDEDNGEDSSVNIQHSTFNIHVEEGAVVNIGKPDSEPPKPKWQKRATTIVASLLGVGAVIDMIIQALHK